VKAVRFDQYGGIDVLKVVDVPRPVPGAGEVLLYEPKHPTAFDLQDEPPGR